MYRYVHRWALITLLGFCACERPPILPTEEDNRASSPAERFRFTLQPADGTQVADPQLVPVEVAVEALAAELHGLEVKMYPHDDPQDLILDLEVHVHGERYVWGHDMDLSGFAEGTVFRLEAVACVDHACEDTTQAVSEFGLP